LHLGFVQKEAARAPSSFWESEISILQDRLIAAVGTHINSKAASRQLSDSSAADSPVRHSLASMIDLPK
jgi:hypothetical protein